MVRSARDANAILDDKSLENKGLRASIPSYFVTCQGVISGISLEVSEKEIVENLVILNNVYKINPIEARRLDRKIIDKDTNRVSHVPSRSVLLTFKGIGLSHNGWRFIMRQRKSSLMCYPLKFAGTALDTATSENNVALKLSASAVGTSPISMRLFALERTVHLFAYTVTAHTC